jgi:predicted DNA-binding protein
MVKLSVEKKTIKLSSELEKKLKKLETISGKDREFILKEALLRFFEELENTPKVPNLKKTSKNRSMVVELPKDWIEHLEYLEKTTSKTKDYYVKEALFRHLENIHELQIALDVMKSKTLSKTITHEELVKKLNL